MFTLDTIDPIASTLLLGFLALASGDSLIEHVRHHVPTWLGGTASH